MKRISTLLFCLLLTSITAKAGDIRTEHFHVQLGEQGQLNRLTDLRSGQTFELSEHTSVDDLEVVSLEQLESTSDKITISMHLKDPDTDRACRIRKTLETTDDSLRYAVEKAADRGLIVTQHHIEPLGVGAFNFDDYFEKQGKQPPLFSYLKHPEALKEVWETYVKAWSRYDDVIWQLGLRGRGDRAMWLHDPSIPKDDAARGKIISDAIRYQYELVRKHDPDGYMTLTLWLEMAKMMQHGHIDLPDDINIVFADNSPGWGFSPDFHQVRRVPDKQYGVYYHHQLWGTGPHFIQIIPPETTCEVLATAVAHDSNDYCMLNVGNIREFVYGLKLSSDMLFDWEEFDVGGAKDHWFDFHYGRWSDEAKEVYQQFFDLYLLDNENRYSTGFTDMPNSPYILDGNLAWRMKQMLEDFNRHFGQEPFRGDSWITAGERVSASLDPHRGI